MDPVTIECAVRVAVVTLNRPDALNAMSRSLQDELAHSFRALENDDDVDVVILTGAGHKAFSAGLDLKELGQGAIKLGDEGGAQDCVAALLAMSKPTIAAINGVAITGGFELALACDILIASTNARFADTHVRMGVVPGWGLSQRLSRTVGLSRAKQLSLSGNFIDAQTALEWGLVNEVVAPEQLMSRARTLAADIASSDRQMVARYKQLIDDGFAMPLTDAMALERQTAQDYNSALDPKDLEARRSAVQARGRASAT